MWNMKPLSPASIQKLCPMLKFFGKQTDKQTDGQAKNYMLPNLLFQGHKKQRFFGFAFIHWNLWIMLLNSIDFISNTWNVQLKSFWSNIQQFKWVVQKLCQFVFQKSSVCCIKPHDPVKPLEQIILSKYAEMRRFLPMHISTGEKERRISAYAVQQLKWFL